MNYMELILQKWPNSSSTIELESFTVKVLDEEKREQGAANWQELEKVRGGGRADPGVSPKSGRDPLRQAQGGLWGTVERPEKGWLITSVIMPSMKTKLRKIGSGFGVLLPKRVVDNLRLQVGDELELTEEEWGIELSPFDPEFAAQLEAFGRTEAQHRNSYRELGKKK